MRVTYLFYMKLSLVLAMAILGSRALAGPAAVESIRISSTIPPVGALVHEVAGDLGIIALLLPPGASPHEYEPGPESLQELARAEILFAIGRDLDGWAERLAHGTNAKVPVVRLGNDLPGPEPKACDHEPLGDPHVWLDPLKAVVMVERIATSLAAIRPAAADSIHARAARFTDRLRALDRLAEERLAPIREIPFVAYHGGLNHMVARYRLNQVAVLEPFPGREPSPRYLKDVITTIRSTGARAVFTEPQVSDRLAAVVAKEAKVPIFEIDALGGLPGRMTYEELFLHDLDVLTGALQGSR